jgi:UDP-glucose 4-epimerase
MEVRGKRVIVTGGAGFIGSHLVDILLARDNEVVVIDDFSSGSRDNLAHHAANASLRVEDADILNQELMPSLFAGAHCVFHLATRNVRLSLRQPTNVHEVNTTGTLNVLKAAAACGVERLLYCSSSEVNGSADMVPMPEQYHYRPETIYGASKLTGEYYSDVFHKSGWLPTVIARPHNSYGPREHYEGYKGEVIPRFILRAMAGQPAVIYGDGLQTRDFTYVIETAAFLLKLMESDAALGGTFNVCKGEEVSIREIANMISEITGLNLPPQFQPSRPSDVLRLYGSTEKLKSLLGETPSVSIQEGLIETVKWFRENVAVTDALLASLQAENWQQLEMEPWLHARTMSKRGG